jgi:hypothetical protein
VSPAPGAADDRLAILELTSRLGLLADERHWAAVEQIFTDGSRERPAAGGSPASP